MLCTPPPPKARGGPVYYSQRVNVIQLYVSKKDQLSVYQDRFHAAIFHICRSSILYISVTHVRIYPTNATKQVLLKFACQGVTSLVYIIIYYQSLLSEDQFGYIPGISTKKCNHLFCIGMTHMIHIRESVDSLCRDGADAQYMQYLSKSRITSQTRKKLI